MGGIRLLFLLYSVTPLYSLRALRLPSRVSQVIVTTGSLPNLPLPKDIDVITVPDERPHLHLVGGTGGG